MKVFISWSGARSHAIAELISTWTKCVLQASHPWISSRDIDRGALWFTEINEKLKEVAVGIVCLTHENKNKPWILFETGALAKGLSSNRVCTLLIDLEPKDLVDPLAQFNHTTLDSRGMRALARTLNSCLGAEQLDEKILDEVFNTYWPSFEERFQTAISETSSSQPVETRSEESLLGEILEGTRSITQRLRRLEGDIDLIQRFGSVGRGVHPGLSSAGLGRGGVSALIGAGTNLNGAPSDLNLDGTQAMGLGSLPPGLSAELADSRAVLAGLSAVSMADAQRSARMQAAAVAAHSAGKHAVDVKNAARAAHDAAAQAASISSAIRDAAAKSTRKDKGE